MNSADPKLRSDAKANRERLLAAAREAFDADPSASLNSIAKAAQVGPGTLYRHFPTRESLIVAVNSAQVEGLVDEASALVAEMPPLDALRTWCKRLVTFVRRQRGFAELLRATLSEQEMHETYRPVARSLEILLAACEEAGEIAPGTDPADLQLLLSFIWQIRTAEGEERAARVVEIMIEGLRRRA